MTAEVARSMGRLPYSQRDTVSGRTANNSEDSFPCSPVTLRMNFMPRHRSPRRPPVVRPPARRTRRPRGRRRCWSRTICRRGRARRPQIHGRLRGAYVWPYGTAAASLHTSDTVSASASSREHRPKNLGRAVARWRGVARPVLRGMFADLHRYEILQAGSSNVGKGPSSHSMTGSLLGPA